MTTLPPGYEAIRPLGAGGFGEVILARHVALDRLVAVKRIHDHALSGPDDLERFRREGQVLAALAHPAVVRVFDFRRDDAGAVLVMEYVEGASLADLLDAGPPPIAQLLPALADVADALAAGAAHGIAHRDVKPGNVFVLPDGHAKLGDFGLARIATDPSVFRTADGITIGTPAYLAPETGLTEPDAGSDAYSFAVMAFEVLTGRLPFEGLSGAAMLAAHLAAVPPGPADVVPGMPQDASDAVLAGLAKDPAKRLLPQELMRRLAAVPASAWPQPVRSTRAAAPTVRVAASVPPLPVPRPRRRRRGPLLLLGALVATAAGVVLLTRGSPAFVVQDVAITAAPQGGRCPSATSTVTVTFRTNGQAGTIRGRWTTPTGTAGGTVNLPVVSGQHEARAVLTVGFRGTKPVSGVATLTLTAPMSGQFASPVLAYGCP